MVLSETIGTQSPVFVGRCPAGHVIGVLLSGGLLLSTHNTGCEKVTMSRMHAFNKK